MASFSSFSSGAAAGNLAGSSATPVASSPFVISNISGLILIKLDGTNHLMWKSSFVPILRGQNLMHHVDGSPSPDSSSSEYHICPIMMSAGELESGNAGEPAKLVRQRYREAADIIKKGKMCCLFINDLDAGAGRMGGTTQYTVNNQMVNATLMNIADNPTNVQLPGMYNKQVNARVPIIVTGNDFSTLYAPLIRDGRMEKFYWAPTREDRVGVCKGIFRTDDIPDEDVTQIVDTFPGQSIDFFGALRARVYDDEVRKWISESGVEMIGKKLVNSKDGPPDFTQPKMTLQKLLEYGNMLVMEQENVKRVQLADKYMSEAALGDANEDEIKSGAFYGKAAQQVKVPVPEGCTDRNATNFDPTARSDDGSCQYQL